MPNDVPVGFVSTSTRPRRALPIEFVRCSLLDRTAGSQMWVATETETEEVNLAQRTQACGMPNPWPELKNLPEAVVWKQLATLSLSPLRLGLSNVDDLNSCHLLFGGPVPGAPRWRSRLLLEDECGMEAMQNESVS